MRVEDIDFDILLDEKSYENIFTMTFQTKHL